LIHLEAGFYASKPTFHSAALGPRWFWFTEGIRYLVSRFVRFRTQIDLMASFIQILSDVLHPPPHPRSVQALIQRSHTLAIAHFRHRAQRKNRYLTSIFGIDIEDLALDCIADLFARGEDGGFPKLQDYFHGMDWQCMDDAGLQIALRRLVYTKVRDGLFRRHREADPGLARIIRNVKLAVQSHPGLCLTRYQHQTWILTTFTQADPIVDPVAPDAILESYLTARIGETTHIPHVVEILHAFTVDYPFYAPGHPLSHFAQIIRTAFVRLEAVEDDVVLPSVRVDVQREEVAAMIRAALESVADDMRPSYVGKGKVAAATFDAYLRATEDVLVPTFVDPYAEAHSLYTALRCYLPGLTLDEYRDEHRHRLEYLSKKVRLIFLSTSRRAYT